MFALAITYGLTVLKTHYTNSATGSLGMYALYIIACVASGVFITGFLFEIGHLLGAKVGGYSIISWNLLFFTFYRDGEKFKFKFSNFDGLIGETKIAPNYEKKEKPNPLPYLLYGTFFNLAWIIGCIALFIYFNKLDSKLDSDFAYAFLTAGIISLALSVYNIVPAKFDTVNDGYRLKLVVGDKDHNGFNELLAAQNVGIVVSKKEESATGEIVAKESKFSAEANLNKVYSLLENKDYAEAQKCIDDVIANEETVSRKAMLEARIQNIYIAIMTKTHEECLEYYDKEVPLFLRKEISAENTLVAIRTYILMAGLLDGSRSECLVVLAKLNKAYKNTPSNRKHSELVLFNEALDLVCKAHPKWELEIYKLFE